VYLLFFYVLINCVKSDTGDAASVCLLSNPAVLVVQHQNGWVSL